MDKVKWDTQLLVRQVKHTSKMQTGVLLEDFRIQWQVI